MSTPKMKDWQYNVLFVLAVVGAVVMLFGEKIGVNVRPEVVGVFGLVMAFILQQKSSSDDHKADEKPATPKPQPTHTEPPADAGFGTDEEN